MQKGGRIQGSASREERSIDPEALCCSAGVCGEQRSSRAVWAVWCLMHTPLGGDTGREGQEGFGDGQEGPGNPPVML